MNFFFDNNLSPKLAEAMDILEDEGHVTHLRDQFSQDERDEVWLEYVGNQGMILITRDQKIFKRPAEFQAFIRHNVKAFILTGKNIGKWKEIKQLICAWEEIKNLGESVSPPFIFQVPPRGKIKRLSY